MKKIISLLALVSLILVGCSSKPDENSLEGMTLNKVGGKLDIEEMELISPNYKARYKDPKNENRVFFILEESNIILKTTYDFSDKSTVLTESDKSKVDELIKADLPTDAVLIERKSDFVDVYESKLTGRTYWVSIQYGEESYIEFVRVIANEISGELKLEPNKEREEELEKSLKNRVGTKLDRNDLKQITPNTFGNESLTYEVDSENNIIKIIENFTLKGTALLNKKNDGYDITERFMESILPLDANMIDKKGENTYIYESKKTGLKYKVEWKVTPDNKVSAVEVVEHKG